MDEATALRELIASARLDDTARDHIRVHARALIERVRAERSRASGVDALMNEFALSSDEGIALMCLAEALLRIPDDETADRLIRDKLARGDWRAHLGGSESLFVNAACWGLVITGKLVRSEPSSNRLGAALTGLLERLGEPVIRTATRVAMGFLGDQFVLGQSIDQALERAARNEARGYRYSYDMLGEAAMTAGDAARYHEAYVAAIRAIGAHSAGRGVYAGPGISVKLSALHPRYSRSQHRRVMHELIPRMKALMLLARGVDIGINIDAEEADRLDLSLDVAEALALDRDLAGWQGLGVVVQSYQQRAPRVIDWLLDLARRSGHRLMVRLVKGAYWDAEIKHAQVDGLPGYPVFTRKVYSDVAYLACARKLLAHPELVYAQFATHNAVTLASIAEGAGHTRDFEFQCLHGMGETLYDQVVGGEKGFACRIYAPVGTHETLLAYLVRRLLENGANSSFVNQIVDPQVPVERLLDDPVQIAERYGGTAHPSVRMPIDIYPDRCNSSGVDLADELALAELQVQLNEQRSVPWHAEPMLGEHDGDTAPRSSILVVSPADTRIVVGRVSEASERDIGSALSVAARAQTWRAAGVEERASVLERAADLIEDHRARFIHLAVHEAGKTIGNAIGEVREAADFCRYYALQARAQAKASPLGSVLCISPWNFPLSIFVGQVAGALAAGNAVIAKPAEQTPLIAAEAVRVLRHAGVPPSALQFLPGRGETVGARLAADARIDGVVFTGSTDVAQSIHRCLAARGNVPLIAETGGQNAMIVDSSALPEQVIADVLASAFDSAGQRCSALRVLCVQDDIADRIIAMLRGAMQELSVGDPARLSTDVGPIIDAPALRGLREHVERMSQSATLIAQAPAAAGAHGHFLSPVAFEIASIRELTREVFGPVLHVVRYRRDALPQLLDDLDATGYGLTLGIHSRIDSTIDSIARRMRVGNIYVNRNMIGAVVGVQPFGGERWSGTGPKAGGPWYVRALSQPLVSRSTAEPFPIAPTTRQPVTDAGMALQTVRGDAVGEDPRSVLEALVGHSDPGVAQIAQAYLADLDDLHERELPGATGERNTWRVAPRGLCVALGGDDDDVSLWLGQALAALAAGNPVLLAYQSDASAAEHVAKLVRSSGWTRVAAARASDVDWADLPDLAAVLAGERTLAAQAVRRVAHRAGTRIPVVEPAGHGSRYPTWRLAAERTVSVNTVAVGGNAYLLSQVD